MPVEDVKLDEKIKVKISEPKKYKVVFLNDDHTPMEFVTDVLVEIFRHTLGSAHQVMLQIHNTGASVVGVYPYEIAEQKSLETTQLARAEGFPLQVKMEADS